MDDLNSFIQNTPHPQELKRALAVQMTQQGYTYREIQNVLQVSLGFVTSCNQRYETGGVTGLKLNYCGTHGYLLAQQKQELFGWLKQRDFWQLEEVIDHIEQTYDLVFKSKQSYYDLLKEAGLRRNFSGRLNLPESSAWKKSQTTHPDKEDRQVQQKKGHYGVTSAMAQRNRSGASKSHVLGRMSFALGRCLWVWVEQTQ